MLRFLISLAIIFVASMSVGALVGLVNMTLGGITSFLMSFYLSYRYLSSLEARHGK
jgi:hypothetical protein